MKMGAKGVQGDVGSQYGAVVQNQGSRNTIAISIKRNVLYSPLVSITSLMASG
jgi:hypothetical protein